MDGNTVLNDKELAVLGNSLLLGSAMDFLNRDGALKLSWLQQMGVSQDGSSDEDLEDALEAADLLDLGLKKSLMNAFNPLASEQDRTDAMLNLQGIETEWARAEREHFDLSVPALREGQLRKVVSDSGPDEVRKTPLGLIPFELRSTLRSLVIPRLVAKGLNDLRISAEEFRLIGIDGLVLRRRHTRPPNWSDWNSPVARERRNQEGFEGKLLQRADRHILTPILSKLSESKTPEVTEDLAYWVASNWDAIDHQEVPIAMTLSELGGEIHERVHPEYHKATQLFENYGALSHGSLEVMADPRNFLMFAWEQIGLIAVKRGWALCFALDGLNEQIVGWVNPKVFESIALGEALQPSNILNATKVGELGSMISEISGADRLRFIITSDIADIKGIPASLATRAFGDLQSKKTILESTDEPFVEEGLQMLTSGQARSANAAASALVNKYGEIHIGKWEVGSSKIPSRSLGRAQNRLQKKIARKRKQA